MAVVARYRPRTMSDCLALRGVSKSYTAGIRGCSATVRVLRDVDLDVAAGEFVGVHAAPASGKSTLLMCAAGLLRPDRGSVSWFGGVSRRDGTTPSGISYVSDRPFPYAFLSVREAVEYAAIVRDLPLGDHAARVSETLEHTSLSAVSHRRVDALDGAQLSRLALASALLSRPRLLLVDDLGSGCDAGGARDLLVLLRSAAADGAGVLIAGRLVPWLEADEPLHGAHTRTRCVALVDGRIEPTPQLPTVGARPITASLPAARVAEWSSPAPPAAGAPPSAP